MTAEAKAVSDIRGKAGEDAVCDYLEEKGCQVIKRNFRVKHGEIDIISLDEDFIVFTEVKTRKYGALESGTRAMNKAKMKRIISAADIFVCQNPQYRDFYRRFDTAYVTVTTDKYPQILDIEYYRADFTAMNL